MLGSFSLPFDHGLLLVQANGSSAVHDGWDPSQEDVHVDNDSIYVAVMDREDGVARVEVVSRQQEDWDVPPEGLLAAYDGTLHLGDRKLFVGDSDGKIAFAERVGESVNVRIFVDERKFAQRVVVAIVAS